METTLDKALIKATINGKEITAPECGSILEVCRDNGIYIPTLCYDERLEAYGGCRLCVVEVKGVARPLSSCTTPLQKGMEIVTESENLTRLRSTIVSLLLSDHPNDCMFCEKAGSCTLQELAYRYGVRSDTYAGERRNIPITDINPFIYFDPNKCVLCGRCVNICQNLVKVGTIDMTRRGFQSRPDTAFGRSRSNDNCVFCGQCISACPVGALVEKPSMGKGRGSELKHVRTTCTYCGTGCNFYLNVKDNQVVRVTSDYSAPVNKGNLCIKGRFGYEFINHESRIRTPLIRDGEGFREASWDEALDYTAGKFKEILQKYGSESVGAFSSARCTNEENYLIAKWVRTSLGNNNVDNCARVCHAPTVAGLATSLGAGAASNSFNQISGADLLLIFGSNTTEGHPIVSLQINKAIDRGAKIIVGDPRKIEMVQFADVWLNLKPGTNIALLNGLIHVIVKEGLQNENFIKNRTEGFDELKELVKDYTPERVQEITGVDREKIIKAARMYAKAKNAMIIYGLGVTEHRSGTENAMSIANLALTCGHIGRPCTGIMALRGQNNVQGASDMGPAPNIFPGYQPVTNPDVREKFERAWNVKLSPKIGLKSVEMLDEAKKGAFKGLLILGEDPGHTDADLHHVWGALKSLEFLAVIDIFHTETTRFAHVILPGASFAENDGTFTNGERRIQRVRKAIEPLSGLAEWQIICELSSRMGYPMKYNHPSEVMDEIASLTPIYAGVSYDRLESGGLQWPCPSREHPGTETLYTSVFSRAGGLAKFVPLEYKEPGETTDGEYPFILITGRRREHYNNGSMTRRVKGIAELYPEERLEINQEDADRLNIKDKETVRVSSRRGEILVKAGIMERSQQGQVFLSFHYQDALSNLLTSEHRDPITGTPEYKVCAVKVEKQ